MPQTETAIQRFPLADRENACGRCNPAIPNDDTAVVQSGLGMKNGEQQLDGEIGLKLNACFFVNADGSVSFDGEQSAELFTGELCYCFGKVVNHFPLLAAKGKNRMPAQFRQGAPKFRLENNNQGDSQKDREAVNDPANDGQFQERRDQGQSEKNDRETGQHLRTPGPAEIKVAIINYHR